MERRRRRLSLPDPQAYADCLQSSSDELENLIDALVIHETRFFRDHAVFEQIHAWVKTVVPARRQTLRILSAPCSTGQEPYSVAGILQLAGRPPSDFTIDAFDISRTALTAAENGTYPPSALDHVPAELRHAFGRCKDGRWQVHEDLRARVRFERRNLALPGALDDQAGYDLILCRNLFIYLHAAARAVLADSLSRALRSGGRLIIGTGDHVAEIHARFAPLQPSAGFAFTHKVNPRPPLQSGSPGLATPPRFPQCAEAETAPAPSTLPHQAADFYQRAMEYCECGNLRQAERRCRQALYLSPDYLPALELLSALWQMHPSSRLRRALHARIRRVQAGACDGIPCEREAP